MSTNRFSKYPKSRRTTFTSRNSRTFLSLFFILFLIWFIFHPNFTFLPFPRQVWLEEEKFPLNTFRFSAIFNDFSFVCTKLFSSNFLYPVQLHFSTFSALFFFSFLEQRKKGFLVDEKLWSNSFLLRGKLWKFTDCSLNELSTLKFLELLTLNRNAQNWNSLWLIKTPRTAK